MDTPIDLERIARIGRMNREQLYELVMAEIETLSQKDATAVLANRFCDSRISQKIADSRRLKGYQTVITGLVANRSTPQSQALSLVPLLPWSQLLRLSTDVRLHPVVRRAMDVQLLARLTKFTLGQKISSARSCSRDLAKALMLDPDSRVFEAALDNSRLIEDDLVVLIGSTRPTAEQLQLVASHGRWSARIAIRRALVLNQRTPRAVAASQLRFLTRADLRQIRENPSTSVYVRRCIENLEGGGEVQRD